MNAREVDLGTRGVRARRDQCFGALGARRYCDQREHSARRANPPNELYALSSSNCAFSAAAQAAVIVGTTTTSCSERNVSMTTAVNSRWLSTKRILTGRPRPSQPS